MKVRKCSAEHSHTVPTQLRSLRVDDRNGGTWHLASSSAPFILAVGGGLGRYWSKLTCHYEMLLFLKTYPKNCVQYKAQHGDVSNSLYNAQRLQRPLSLWRIEQVLKPGIFPKSGSDLFLFFEIEPFSLNFSAYMIRELHCERFPCIWPEWWLCDSVIILQATAWKEFLQITSLLIK